MASVDSPKTAGVQKWGTNEGGTKPLTDIKIRSAKPRPGAYKLYDARGLYVLVHANGSRYWRLRYRYAGKEKNLALGVYPD